MIGTLRQGFFVALLAAVVGISSPPGARASGIITFTGLNGSLVKFDRESLRVVQGSFETNSTSGDHLAYDEDGCLFGSHRNTLLELDPETFQILNERSVAGTVQGLVVQDGKIYTLTGIAGELIAFDRDSFEVVQGEIGTNSTFGTVLVGNQDGRLFSARNGKLIELDPTSGAVLNEREIGYSMSAIAAYGSLLVAFTGTNGSLVSFDADNFETLEGSIEINGATNLSLAFDNTGRLFGNRQGTLVEIDPETLEIIDSREQIGGTMVSMAAYDPPPLLPPGETLALISSIGRIGGQIRLTIPPTFRRRIGVEYSESIAPGMEQWFELGNFFESGEGDLVFIDPDPKRTLQEKGYYRAFLRPLIP